MNLSYPRVFLLLAWSLILGLLTAQQTLNAGNLTQVGRNQTEALQLRLAALQGLLEESENSNEVGWLQFGIRTIRRQLEQEQ